ncbi:MAG TPA: DUF1415 domain-containing protein [Spongiibacteraceae bacterium]
MDVAAAAAVTRRWIEQFVVAENLCPFAAPVLRANQLRVAVCTAADEPALALALLEELDLLQRTPELELATSVLVFTAALTDFEHYLDFLALADELLKECGLDGIVQIASFHPRYCFAGVAVDDIGNFTNRSPLPMVHLLREASISRALENYSQPAAIPARNIAHLQALGVAAVAKILTRITAGG